MGKKLTYTKAELQAEAKYFSLYVGRMELMPDIVKVRYERFIEKCRVYDEENSKRHII